MRSSTSTRAPRIGRGSTNWRSNLRPHYADTSGRITTRRSLSSTSRPAPDILLAHARACGPTWRLLRFAHLDHCIAESEGRVPHDFDGVFDALMRGTSFRVDSQRALDRLSVFAGCRQVIVERDRLNSDRPTHADNATVNGSGELVAVEGNLTPCQGAGKRA